MNKIEKDIKFAGRDNAARIKAEVQIHGRYIARLPVRSAARTIKALRADDYGTRLIVKNTGDGYELWTVVGEPFEDEAACPTLPRRFLLQA